ncbi:MAG TPA: cupredoxin family protein [Burkholderiales bacterium]|nr:cupredoxin family protein [Burkholderiales bacterium]
MHHVRPVLAAAMAACIMTLGSAAYGHGDGGHGKPKAFDPSKVEEKPFGRAGNPKHAKRTIRITMNDQMQFVAASAHTERRTDAVPAIPPHAMPADIVVKRGDTVRFVVHNDGKVMHEMVIGTMAELKEHAELMRKFPNMEHDEPYMAHVAPAKQGEIVWQFTQTGEFHYACLIPGHMEAGMIAKITVK